MKHRSTTSTRSPTSILSACRFLLTKYWQHTMHTGLALRADGARWIYPLQEPTSRECPTCDLVHESLPELQLHIRAIRLAPPTDVFVRCKRARRAKTTTSATLCYAIVHPGWKSAFRAGFWPDCHRATPEIGPPAGLRLAGAPVSVLSRWQCGPNPAPNADLRPVSIIA